MSKVISVVGTPVTMDLDAEQQQQQQQPQQHGKDGQRPSTTTATMSSSPAAETNQVPSPPRPIGGLPRKRAASINTADANYAMFEKLKINSAASLSSSASMSLDTPRDHICLCTPAPKIPRPRNGELQAVVVVAVVPCRPQFLPSSPVLTPQSSSSTANTNRQKSWPTTPPYPTRKSPKSSASSGRRSPSTLRTAGRASPTRRSSAISCSTRTTATSLAAARGARGTVRGPLQEVLVAVVVTMEADVPNATGGCCLPRRRGMLTLPWPRRLRRRRGPGAARTRRRREAVMMETTRCPWAVSGSPRRPPRLRTTTSTSPSTRR